MVNLDRVVRRENLLIASVVTLAFASLAKAQTQLPARIAVGSTQICGVCRVQRTSVVALKDTEHLSIANEASLLIDGRGQVYAQDIQTKQYMMFDPRGKWLGRVGGVGNGPGEFKATISAKVDPFDTLWVSNPGQRRLSVFAPGSRVHVRDVRVEAQIGNHGGDWLLLHGGQFIVSLPNAPDPADRLVRMGVDGRAVKRFGPEAELRLRSATVTPARDGKHFWRVRVTATSYVIEKWTNEGVLVQLTDRAAKWWALPYDKGQPARRPGGGDIRVESVREAADGKLWVIMQLPRQEYWEDRPRPEKVQERSLPDAPQHIPSFNRVLEVLDPVAGKLLYSDPALASLYSVITPDVVLCDSREDDNGFRMVGLCRLTLVK